MLKPNFVQNYQNQHVLANTYHKGMVHIWNGIDLLHELNIKHPSGQGGLSEEKRQALARVLSLIVWGEYAAWQTSAALAFEIDDFGGKMAATSQAHDEARHYFVMCDYLWKFLEVPMDEIRVSSTATYGLEAVVKANTLSKKLLGMQLMVEPVAISIFHALRKSKVEPVLCELLEYYIRDEARHIALGVRQLPKEIEKMSWTQVLQLFVWQSRILKIEIDGLFELKDDLETLGINYLDLFKEAERRQIKAAKEMAEHLDWNFPIEGLITRVTETYLKAKNTGWI